jgi:hypothetical protein
VGEPWSSTDIYDLEGGGDWRKRSKREGVDWVMIALLIAALLAVLGLIPLWRAIYSRYVTGPASSYVAPHRLETSLVPDLLGEEFQVCQPERVNLREPFGWVELDECAFVWYNSVLSGISLAHLHPTKLHATHLSECREMSSGFWSPAYG